MLADRPDLSGRLVLSHWRVLVGTQKAQFPSDWDRQADSYQSKVR